MFNTGLSQSQVLANIQSRLIALRQAFEDVQNLYAWSSGIQQSDLENAGFSADDANTVLEAINDANAVAQIYDTGLPPANYPQPPSAYQYSTWQRQIIGPQ